MKNNILKLAAVGLFIWSLGAQADNIVYQVDRAFGGATVIGTIETDGMIGSLSIANIRSWSFEVDDGSGEHGPVTFGSDSGGDLTGSGWQFLIGTETELLFDFDAAFAVGSFQDVQFFKEGSDFSYNYGWAANPGLGWKKEQFVHFFPGDFHLAEALRNGVEVVGRVDGEPAPAGYIYRLLDHPGTAETQVFGVNESGAVVGIGLDGLGGLPFIYSSTQDTLTDVAPAAGYASTGVLDISNPGVMVGSVTSQDLSTRSGFLRDKDGTFTFFSHPDAVSSTLPRGVNSDGLVSGYRDSPDGTVGFIYDPATETFTDIVPSLFTIAHGINSKGQVVGSAIFFDSDAPCDSPDPSSGIERYGWLRAADGSVTYFQINGQRTQTRGINDAGFVVGDFLDPESGKRKGFTIKLAGGSSCELVNVDNSDALEFPGFSLTLPEGIRNSGDIVGIVIDESGVHGFIATPR